MPDRIVRCGRKTCLWCRRSLSNGEPLTDHQVEWASKWAGRDSTGTFRRNYGQVAGSLQPAAYHADCWLIARYWDARCRIVHLVESVVEPGRELGWSDEKIVGKVGGQIAELDAVVEATPVALRLRQLRSIVRPDRSVLDEIVRLENQAG